MPASIFFIKKVNNTVKIKTLKQEFIYVNTHKGKFAGKLVYLMLQRYMWYNYPTDHIAVWCYNMHMISI